MLSTYFHHSFKIAFVAIFVALIVTACGTESNTSSPSNQSNSGSQGNQPQTNAPEQVEPDPRADWPAELVYAVIPTEDQETITARTEPMAAYLSNQLGIPVTVFSGTDYNANIEAMRNNHVHIAYLGPFAYTLARERANAEAFAVHLRSPTAEPTYTAMFITLDDSGIETFSDLENRSFAWADPSSASGYLFPRAHLIDALNITNDEVDSFFSATVFSGGHESSVLSVMNGDVDAAAVSSGSGLRAMDKHIGHRNGERVKVFGYTRDIPGAPYTYRSDLPESLKEAIREAFYNAIDAPELADFLEESRVLGGYVPIDDSFYEVIDMTGRALGMSAEELLK